MAHAAHNPFDHVNDANFIEIWPSTGWKIDLPPIPLGFYNFQITKYMVLQVLAAALICAIYIPLARRIRNGGAPKGLWDNAFESVLTFVRDNIARPYIGEHDGDKFLPFLWTVFLYVLINNLFGLVPFLGSPTASLGMTLALALCSFCMIHGAPIAKHGLVHYLQSYLPHTDMHGPILIIGLPVLLLVAAIEIFGTVIKAGVLALRLFANMLAGHSVMAFILFFIDGAKNTSLFWPVTAGTVAGLVALSFLELFVAFLQAFVFTFLTALFLGSALHPEH